MAHVAITLSKEQTEKILKIVNPHFESCRLWEEFEIYYLKGSKAGRLYIYIPLVVESK